MVTPKTSKNNFKKKLIKQKVLSQPSSKNRDNSLRQAHHHQKKQEQLQIHRVGLQGFVKTACQEIQIWIQELPWVSMFYRLICLQKQTWCRKPLKKDVTFLGFARHKKLEQKKKEQAASDSQDTRKRASEGQAASSSGAPPPSFLCH